MATATQTLLNQRPLIRATQLWLHDNGYYGGTTHGTLGPDTIAALRKAFGVAPGALDGDIVVAIQTKLKESGLYTGEANGVVSDELRLAFRQYIQPKPATAPTPTPSVETPPPVAQTAPAPQPPATPVAETLPTTKMASTPVPPVVVPVLAPAPAPIVLETPNRLVAAQRLLSDKNLARLTKQWMRNNGFYDGSIYGPVGYGTAKALRKAFGVAPEVVDDDFIKTIKAGLAETGYNVGAMDGKVTPELVGAFGQYIHAALAPKPVAALQVPEVVSEPRVAEATPVPPSVPNAAPAPVPPVVVAEAPAPVPVLVPTPATKAAALVEQPVIPAVPAVPAETAPPSIPAPVPVAPPAEVRHVDRLRVVQKIIGERDLAQATQRWLHKNGHFDGVTRGTIGPKTAAGFSAAFDADAARTDDEFVLAVKTKLTDAGAYKGELNGSITPELTEALRHYVQEGLTLNLKDAKAPKTEIAKATPVQSKEAVLPVPATLAQEQGSNAPEAVPTPTTTVVSKAPPPIPAPDALDRLLKETGRLILASMYGEQGADGDRFSTPNLAEMQPGTSHGRPYISKLKSAASVEYSIGTILAVQNPANGRMVLIRINDKGPYAINHAAADSKSRYSVGPRKIDLSLGAARALGFDGLGKVRVAVVPPKLQWIYYGQHDADRFMLDPKGAFADKVTTASVKGRGKNRRSQAPIAGKLREPILDAGTPVPSGNAIVDSNPPALRYLEQGFTG